MSTSVYQTTAPIHRTVATPVRTYAQRRADREREMTAQADRLYSELFTALKNGNRGFAQRVLEKMFDLRGEYLDIVATAQSEAGEESQVMDEWERSAA